MQRRNYHELSPYDFECLVRDLLSAEWSERLESFPPGADGGIDVRLLKSLENIEVVIQCKHSPGKTWSGISGMLAREAEKIKDKRWSEYWLATSASLSPQGKKKVADLFDAQNLVPERVVASTDLDALLNKHPDVERSNYKLYLTSVAVLEMLLHNELFVHAQDLLTGIESRRKYYVQGRSLAKAQEILEKNRVCIISGPPGVGKTTLAEMISLNLIEEGYRPFWISEDPREADIIWRSGEKQFFLYDDFLGKNALADKMGVKGDARLLALMDRVKNSSNHFLIMTTREYILSAARQTYELLRSPTIDYSKIIVDLSSYTEFHRAHILYNHVYFSDLGIAARRSLVERKQYKKIIAHWNYNPRLIRFIIDSAVAAGGQDSGAGFAAFMLKSLLNPSELWGHIFTHQISQVARDMLLVLLTFGGYATLGEFRSAVKFYREVVRGGNSSMEEIQNGLSVLDGAFINVFESGDGRAVRFANPGIADYLYRYLRDNPFLYENLASGSNTPEQVITVWGFTQADKAVHGELYLPEIANEFRKSPEFLLQAMLRVIREGKEGRIWAVRTPLASFSSERVATLAANLSKRISNATLSGTVAIACAAFNPRWSLKRGDKHWALSFIRASRVVLVQSDAGIDLIESVRAWFAGTLHEADDYVKYRELEEAVGGRENEGDDLFRESFIGFARDQLDSMLESDDLDSIVREFGELKSALEDFDISSEIESYIESVENRISELEQEYPDESDDDDWPGESGGEDDGDIDNLFSTLE
ncbi:restriction endonuclease [Lentzea sp. NEAU-D7]|uniref:nSTAND3 domain-containing NTPase n=1 Tax=Lentzea sp. NEAU-D7 TaxID=2994667 RepID=UPI00224AC7E2|nr:restriction endonuclease [Lentzea sp. NEAU-D7]MCX2953775.1 restriction endonuclease [Lentzea sp. NEAU-D7]